MENPTPASAIWGATTETTIVSLLTHPLTFVNVYVSIKDPTEEGVKTPALVTPVPLQIPVPPVVGEYPVNVVGTG